jgi:hypothetical protein
VTAAGTHVTFGTGPAGRAGTRPTPEFSRGLAEAINLEVTP